MEAMTAARERWSDDRIDGLESKVDEGTRAFNRTMVMFCAVLLAAVIGLAGTVVTVAVV